MDVVTGGWPPIIALPIDCGCACTDWMVGADMGRGCAYCEEISYGGGGSSPTDGDAFARTIELRDGEKMPRGCPKDGGGPEWY